MTRLPDVDKQAWLIVRSQGTVVGKYHLAGKAFWKIGRASDCDIIIHDPYISRHQATIELRPRGNALLYLIRDNNSRNGTLINGTPLSDERVLHHGDIIMMGDTDLTFRYTSPTPSVTPNVLQRS
ncbi:FHA domain-containing protein [Thermosynechococcus sichuanensis E542]|uniref:FHA domain-containing protein n=1 Tax=Thermosynechococcus sichuanensis E542 TaxID=2016101 RepID=A0A7D6ET50_9CYAN|nr:FHA domain-containing protein [Thermosynechococcus vestitus]QLL29902.1 FHA domain-containing protein [Thermosynechococcus vestitus E542]